MANGHRGTGLITREQRGFVLFYSGVFAAMKWPRPWLAIGGPSLLARLYTALMSAFGPWRTCSRAPHRSAFGGTGRFGWL